MFIPSTVTLWAVVLFIIPGIESTPALTTPPTVATTTTLTDSSEPTTTIPKTTTAAAPSAIDHVLCKLIDKDECKDVNAIELCPNRCQVTAGCPEEVGFFGVPGSVNKCYKMFTDAKRTWDNSKKKCEDEKLFLATPVDPVYLRKTIINTYGQKQRVWIGGKGTGIGNMKWVYDGSILPYDNPAWYSFDTSRTATTDCLNLLTEPSSSFEDKPYFQETCGSNYFPLCEITVQ